MTSEQQYLNLLSHVMENGVDKPNRTGVWARSVFGYQMRFDLGAAFPAITTKKLAWNPVVSELLWFIEGSGDERRLREILHGSRDSDNKTIWTANAEAEYWVQSRLKRSEGDLGRVYGVQWRRWRKPLIRVNRVILQEVDQLQQVINSIKEDPNSRRHLVVSYNPGEIEMMALPPCHVLFQFYVANGKLSCQMYQRSMDVFLGAPFNIASYSLLTHMIAQVCKLDVGEFILTVGDAHVYSNHFDQVREQLSRAPLPLPQLRINPDVRNINQFKMEDFELVNYQHHPAITAPMAV